MKVSKAGRRPGVWGEAIRELLHARKMSQADLARAAELPEKTISSIARGQPTTTRMLEAIAVALDVTLAEVVTAPAARYAGLQSPVVEQLAHLLAQEIAKQQPQAPVVWPKQKQQRRS